MAAYYLDLTAEELRAIVTDPTHDAHRFLWSDGATTWDLYNLLDDVESSVASAEEGTYDENVHIEAVDLSEQGEAEFMEAYCEHAPAGYDAEADCEGPQPWCAPFSWDRSNGRWSEFHHYAGLCDYDPAAMGRKVALENYDELAAIIEEEAALNADED